MKLATNQISSSQFTIVGLLEDVKSQTVVSQTPAVQCLCILNFLAMFRILEKLTDCLWLNVEFLNLKIQQTQSRIDSSLISEHFTA